MKYQLLPALSTDEYERLRADIEAHGIRQPIELDENGDVLDGHHRKAIAFKLGIDCPSVEVVLKSEVAKRAYVLRVNLNRRQLTSEQQKGIRQRQKEIAVEMNEDHTQQEIGDELGVPLSTVNDWLVAVASSNVSGSGNAVKPDHRKHHPPEKVAEVLAGLKAGRIAREVAVKTGVPVSTIYDINTKHNNSKPKTKTYPGRPIIEGVRRTIDTLVGLASGLDVASVSDADPDTDEALRWEKDLCDVTSSINRFRRQIKEHCNGH